MSGVELLPFVWALPVYFAVSYGFRHDRRKTEANISRYHLDEAGAFLDDRRRNSNNPLDETIRKEASELLLDANGASVVMT